MSDTFARTTVQYWADLKNVCFIYRKLRCPRNNLHLHLFASFILRATMNLLKGVLFVDGLGMAGDVQIVNGDVQFIRGAIVIFVIIHWFVYSDYLLVSLTDGDLFSCFQNWECKLLTSIWQYAIMANYSWILAEGLYLHNLIFMALFTDSSSINMYVLLGWGEYDVVFSVNRCLIPRPPLKPKTLDSNFVCLLQTIPTS